MADEFIMPKLGLTMEAGTIVRWLVDPGAEVAAGEAVLVIETDKVESEIEAPRDGRLHPTGAIGEEYPCGVGIGWFLAEGETAPATPAAAGGGPAAAGGPTAASGSAADGGATAGRGAAADGGATAGRGAAAEGGHAAGGGSAARDGAAAGAGHASGRGAAAEGGQGAGGGVAAGVEGNGSRAATGAHGRLLASPNAWRLAAERGVDLWAISGTGPGGRITSEDVPLDPPSPAAASPGAGAASASPATGTSGHSSASTPSATPASARPRRGVLATAAARSLADLLGVDVAAVSATGPDPRITRDDVAAHVRSLLSRPTASSAEDASSGGAGTAEGAASSAPSQGSIIVDRSEPGSSGGARTPEGAAPSAPSSAPSQAPSEVIPLAGMRGTIARRMKASLDTTAQLTLTMDVDVDGVVADRDRRRAGAADGDTIPGFTDYVIAAVAPALVEHPYVNSQVTDDGVALLPAVHVGLAVALDDGLIVPVVRDTLGYDLDALAVETTRLATAARERSLGLDDLDGATFSVTALGSYGVDAFTPILNTPNTAILGVGRVRDDVAWSADGQPRRTKRMTLSLTWDHRAFDGAPAAEFTSSVKRRLEAHND